jgi:hypothetical protein
MLDGKRPDTARPREVGAEIREGRPGLRSLGLREARDAVLRGLQVAVEVVVEERARQQDQRVQADEERNQTPTLPPILASQPGEHASTIALSPALAAVARPGRLAARRSRVHFRRPLAAAGGDPLDDGLAAFERRALHVEQHAPRAAQLLAAAGAPRPAVGQ